MKRQTFTLELAALLVAVFTVLNLQAVNTITYTATYDGTLTFGTDTLGGVTYTTVHYDGLFNGGEPGSPSLPVDYIRFSVPWNATSFTVTTSLGNSADFNYSHLAYPCQIPRMMSDTTAQAVTLPDVISYANYPQQNAWVVSDGFLAGENHIVTVAVMPISYMLSDSDNGLHLFRKWSTIQVTLSYQTNDSPNTLPLTRADAAMRQDGFSLTRSMVVNPANVESNAPVSLNRTISGDYRYVIVTTDDLSHPLRRLAALKRQKGYNVQVVTMDDVLGSPYSGQGDEVNNVLTFTDDAGKLRQYLRNYYSDFGTEYVLLAGNGVPYRIKHFYYTDAPTDLYFSDLTADWYAGNTEKNPELYVGRILAKTKEQIDNYTNKLYQYELNPGHGNPSYLKRALYTEGVDMLGNSDSIRQSFGNVFSVDSVIQESAWNKYPAGADIINEINGTQYGYLSFHNHGGPSCITVYGYTIKSTPKAYDHHIKWVWALNSYHHNSSSYYYCDTIGNALDLIDNKWMPNILYSIGCETMPYDTISGYENLPMNFGESFTTGKDYGGPAYLGNTRDGIMKRSDELENVFARQIAGGYFKLGPAEAMSKVFFKKDVVSYNDTVTLGHVVDDRHYFSCVHNLLGDPEFEMWTDIPQQYSNVSITRNNSDISISGIVPDSTIVAFYENGGQATKLIANNSPVTANVDPNSTIMLYKHNYIPYIAPLLLQNTDLENSQYVIASDVIAGSSVDSNRTSGDVIVPSGVDYEIEASGTVTLQGGFQVDLGASFSVYQSTF